jgi:hypothetical protein
MAATTGSLPPELSFYRPMLLRIRPGMPAEDGQPAVPPPAVLLRPLALAAARTVGRSSLRSRREAAAAEAGRSSSGSDDGFPGYSTWPLPAWSSEEPAGYSSDSPRGGRGGGGSSALPGGQPRGGEAPRRPRPGEALGGPGGYSTRCASGGGWAEPGGHIPGLGGAGGLDAIFAPACAEQTSADKNRADTDSADRNTADRKIADQKSADRNRAAVSSQQQAGEAPPMLSSAAAAAVPLPFPTSHPTETVPPHPPLQAHPPHLSHLPQPCLLPQPSLLPAPSQLPTMPPPPPPPLQPPRPPAPRVLVPFSDPPPPTGIRTISGGDRAEIDEIEDATATFELPGAHALLLIWLAA